MERVGNEVVIAAGPHGPAQRDSVQPAFALFRWSGLATRPRLSFAASMLVPSAPRPSLQTRTRMSWSSSATTATNKWVLVTVSTRRCR